MKYKLIMSLIIISALFFTFKITVYAKDNKLFIINETTSDEKLDNYIEYFIDYEREYTIEDILSGQLDSQFENYEGIGRPNFGYTSAGYWVKFNILNNIEQVDWLLEIETPKLNKTELYKVKPNGSYEVSYEGNYYPFHDRRVKSTNLLYILAIDEQEYMTYYLHVTTGSSMQLPLRFWELEAFNQKTNQVYLIFGFLIGISIVMALYNIFLYFSIRDKSYIYYVVFVVVNALLYLSDTGIAFQFLWPEAVRWNLHAVVFFLAIDNIAALLFARSFLHTQFHLPKIDKIIFCLVIVNGLFSVWALFSFKYAMFATLISAILTIFIVIPTSIIIYRKGYRPARIFILAWGVFLSGVFISLLVDAGIFPLTGFTKNAWLFTTVMEVILLSLALGDKYNVLNKEFQKVEQEKKENQQLVLDNLKKVDKLRDEFLASTSHELRTPLNGIIGIAETMRDGIVGDLSPDMDQHLEMIVTSGKRLANLVNDILDFSKLKNNDLHIELNTVNLKQITEIVLQVCQVLVKDKDITLVNQIDDTLPNVLADADRLQQILYNLVGNAIKYTEEGYVVVSAKVSNDKLIIEVKDTGRGIANEILPTIFEPFHQEVDDLSIEGTGIGLYVTKKLIELHRGEIYVHTTVGEGTTFYFTLNVSGAEDTSMVSIMNDRLSQIQAKPETSIKEMPINSKQQTQQAEGVKILIADDEEVNLQVLQNQLVLNGYNVVSVSSGQAVLDYLEKHEVNLLILDIMMPRMSGYEVCKKLRETYALNELPILMLTAKNQLNDKIVSFKVGANDYLTKPCDKEELLARVHTLIQLGRYHKRVVQMNRNLETIVEERTEALKTSNYELNRTNKELQEMSESRQEMLQNIAHEIGTPITVIQGYLQGIEHGLIDLNEKKYLNMVFRKVNVLNRLINDLTDLSNFRAGRFNMSITQMRLNELIALVEEKVETDAVQNTRLYKMISTPNKTKLKNYLVYIDIERIIQVLTNITWNAIKHTRPQTGEIALEISIENDFKELRIRISDNGEGIDEVFLPHIFERFYKHAVTALDDQASSGLGLAITKEIIEAHEGHIWMESEKNVGTSLFIALPIYKN